MNFNASNGKSENLYFGGLLLYAMFELKKYLGDGS